MPVRARTKLPPVAGRWSIEPERSRVGFTIRHLTVATVHGAFQRFDGSLETDRSGLERASGTVEAASIDTGDPKRDEVLLAFYREQLGFEEVTHPAPTFTMLSRGALRLVLSAPCGGPGGGQAMPDGTLPEPGGWNRFQIEVEDLEAAVDDLRERGASFRNEIVTGVGGRQNLVEDPSGNLVELFQPTP